MEAERWNIPVFPVSRRIRRRRRSCGSSASRSIIFQTCGPNIVKRQRYELRRRQINKDEDYGGYAIFRKRGKYFRN